MIYPPKLGWDRIDEGKGSSPTVAFRPTHSKQWSSFDHPPASPAPSAASNSSQLSAAEQASFLKAALKYSSQTAQHGNQAILDNVSNNNQFIAAGLQAVGMSLQNFRPSLPTAIAQQFLPTAQQSGSFHSARSEERHFAETGNGNPPRPLPEARAFTETEYDVGEWPDEDSIDSNAATCQPKPHV